MNWALVFLISSFLHAQQEPQIIGGTDVPSDSPIAKTTVYIQGKDINRNFSCTGLVIDPYVILTAAHCLGTYGTAELSVHFKTSINKEGPVIHVVKRIRHEKYNKNKNYQPRNDIAVVKLEKPAPDNYRAVEFIPPDLFPADGDPVVLAGYGRTEAQTTPDNSNKGVGTLRQADQKILNSHFNESEILIDIKEKGSCFGDSGGPAFFQLKDNYLLVGITSYLSEKNLVPPKPPSHNSSYNCTHEMIYTNTQVHEKWVDGALREILK